jgi:hypothetical protein
MFRPTRVNSKGNNFHLCHPLLGTGHQSSRHPAGNGAQVLGNQHFTEIKTQIKDIEALRAACQELGMTLLQNAAALNIQPSLPPESIVELV